MIICDLGNDRWSRNDYILVKVDKIFYFCNVIYINTHPEALNINAALGRVSPQRRDAALRYLHESDRKLSLAVFLLLQEALEKEYGITQPPELSFGPHGKPFLRDYPHIHFNLSHCSCAALCVVSDAPVGCDVETVQKTLDMDLCSHCCSPQELREILSSAHPELAFCALWTRKEAFLKWTGEGLTDRLPDLLSSPEAAAAHFESHISPDAAFVYSLCRGKNIA